ncbi:MAG: hypothetical protein EOP53_20290 [Sphingobacteriales bacterium]|nr:MAG: hypothetical protein EOP53_20290 [Sphingobacteriales bacterium]
MKYLFSAVILFLFAACGQGDTRPSTALDTGRDFIRASLNGDFKKAERLLINDAENVQLFDSYKRYYEKMPADLKANYRNASYEINKFLEVDDSTTIINYSNSYMKKPMDIKVKKDGEVWGVDFKYTYSGNLPID